MYLLQLGRSIWAAPFFLLHSILPLSAIEAPSNDTELTQSAIRAFAEDPYWLSLLHYKQTLFSQKSTIDDPRFFLSGDAGKTDAAAELAATIQHFSNGNVSDPEHPLNRFPARLNWLQQQLPTSITAQFVATESAPFEAAFKNIAPTAASVIFPTQYMNNPASLFGHSLINIEGKQNQKLLAYSTAIRQHP